MITTASKGVCFINNCLCLYYWTFVVWWLFCFIRWTTGNDRRLYTIFSDKLLLSRKIKFTIKDFLCHFLPIFYKMASTFHGFFYAFYADHRIVDVSQQWRNGPGAWNVVHLMLFSIIVAGDEGMEAAVAVLFVRHMLIATPSVSRSSRRHRRRLSR